MKFITAILSIYIMVLTAMPCSDNIVDTNSVSFEMSNHNHSDEVDLCSPFCFCNCCKTVSQLAITNEFRVDRIIIEMIFSILIQSETECLTSYWRPPKI